MHEAIPSFYFIFENQIPNPIKFNNVTAQIFDDEIKDSGIKLSNYKLPVVDLRSPESKPLDYNLGKRPLYQGNVGNAGSNYGGLPWGVMRSAPAQTGFDQPFSSVSTATLMENKRYPMYQKDVDLENVYGLQQGFILRIYKPFYDTVYLTREERDSPFLLFVNLLISALLTNFIIYIIIVSIIFLKHKGLK